MVVSKNSNNNVTPFIERYSENVLAPDTTNNKKGCEDAPSPSIETTEKLLNILNNSIATRTKRLASINDICNDLDHFQREKHDQELKIGAGNILFQKLAFVVLLEKQIEAEESRSNSHSHDDLSFNRKYEEEIALLCCALEMVYRANRRPVQESFREIGRNMLTILIEILQRSHALVGDLTQFQDCREPSHDDNFTKYIMMQSVTKILRYFSKSGSGSDKRNIIKRKGLLSMVLLLIQQRRKPDGTSEDDGVRADALAIIGHLAEGESNANSVVLASYEEIVDAVLTSTSDNDSDTREQACFALMHLVCAPKSSFTRLQQDHILDVLVSLMDDRSPGARKFIGATLFNLAYADEYSFQLACHHKGSILNALVRIIGSDPSSKSRSNAAWVLFYLACSESTAAVELLGEGGVPDALANALCNDVKVDVRTPAAKALRRLSEVITKDMQCHSTILPALMKAAGGNLQESTLF